MSIALMAVAWALPLASTDKLVLLALADNANDAGSCWPSMATIARKCGLSERAARVSMRRLEAAGHVSSVDRSGTSRLYTVHPGTSCPPAVDTPRHHVPVTPAPRAPKPSRTTISSTKTSSSPKSARAVAAFALPDWVPADAWDAWLAMRRTKGGKDTAYALNLAIGELTKLKDDGYPPGAVLDQSTLSKWTKLYPIKDTQNGLSPRSNDVARPGAIGLAGPRRGYGADMLASALARTDESPASDPPDDRGIEGPVPAWLRR